MHFYFPTALLMSVVCTVVGLTVISHGASIRRYHHGNVVFVCNPECFHLHDISRAWDGRFVYEELRSRIHYLREQGQLHDVKADISRRRSNGNNTILGFIHLKRVCSSDVLVLALLSVNSFAKKNYQMNSLRISTDCCDKQIGICRQQNTHIPVSIVNWEQRELRMGYGDLQSCINSHEGSRSRMDLLVDKHSSVV